MGSVLIVYRRDDTAAWATRIRQWMAVGHRADWYLELADVPGEGGGPGTLGKVGGLDAVVVLIGPRFLEDGGPGLEVADAVAAAMRAGVDVVPVLVDGAPMPADEDLPAAMRNLVAYRALHMGGSTFEADLGRLADRIEPAEAAPAAASPTTAQSQRIVVIVAALLVLIGAALAVFLAASTETGSLGPLFL